jgi:serine protease AprX
VAGIIAGSGELSAGRYRGVAPEALLLIGRALDAGGGGKTSQVMAAVEWAVEQGADVVNVSLGGGPYPGDGTDALSVLCDAAVREGVTVCVAAGNLGPNEHTVGSPASAADVITVGAADLGEVAVADFSSRGPTADGRVKPDVIFPGVRLVAPRSNGTFLGTAVDQHYTAVSGTSQATPMASGTAALLLQANPRMRPGELKSRIVRGANRLVGVEPISQGAGLGDSYNAFVSRAGSPIGSEVGDPDDGSSPERESADGCLSQVMGRAISAVARRIGR